MGEREREMRAVPRPTSCCCTTTKANGDDNNGKKKTKTKTKARRRKPTKSSSQTTTTTTKRRTVLLALTTTTSTSSSTLKKTTTLFDDIASASSSESSTATTTLSDARYAYEINAKKRLLQTQRRFALQPEIDDTTASDVNEIIEIPMTYDGMSFVLDYYIGEASVRGVVDTGSPFITIRGGEGSENWGFVTKKDIRPSPYEETYEVYGLQVDSSTVWCLGDLRFVTTRDNWSLREMVLGVVNGSMANVGGSINGANASFVGLTKYRQDWIRPTFLEQTDVSSFSIDFVNETLTLSRKNLIDVESDANVLPMVDLRPLGSPVYHYAVVLDDLYINGEKHAFKNKNEKTYVIFDSGTTGLLISNSLYENSAFRDGAFQAAMTFTDVKGNKRSVAIGSSIRTCTRKCLFLCLPLDVPWDGIIEEKSNVIFAGLALLMNQGEMTVDCDEGLLRLKGDPGVNRVEFEADKDGFIPIRTRGNMASDIKLYNET